MLLIFKRRIYLRIVKQSTIIDLVVFVLIQIIFQIQKNQNENKENELFLTRNRPNWKCQRKNFVGNPFLYLQGFSTRVHLLWYLFRFYLTAFNDFPADFVIYFIK